MSRELEALDYIEACIDDMFYGDDGLKPHIKERFDILKQSLTPPTEEELCTALSEYYNTKIYYNKDNYKNGFHNGNVYAIMYENNKVRLTTKYFNSMLPPHLITMIGKFYEGLIE